MIDVGKKGFRSFCISLTATRYSGTQKQHGDLNDKNAEKEKESWQWDDNDIDLLLESIKEFKSQ